MGIYSTSQLLEQALTSRDLVGDAAALKIPPGELDALYKRVILEADPDMIAAMEREALIPSEGGQMDAVRQQRIYPGGRKPAGH